MGARLAAAALHVLGTASCSCDHLGIPRNNRRHNQQGWPVVALPACPMSLVSKGHCSITLLACRDETCQWQSSQSGICTAELWYSHNRGCLVTQISP